VGDFADRTKRLRGGARDSQDDSRDRSGARRRGGRASAFVPKDDFDKQLTDLLVRVKTDEQAKKEFLELLEKMGPNDPRTGDYRKKLPTKLFCALPTRGFSAHIGR
ncbi:MAG: tetratricopeptide repeat protein, partial [Actinomycetota bacterium]